jgi:mono/diheme cytochrome c family protein
MSYRVVGTFLTLSLACLALVASGQSKDKPPFKKVQASRVSPAAGKEMFTHYCAACHGKDGQGHGPAAAALKKAPADLTNLASRNGGKFPDTRVYGFIEGSDEVAAHGSREMPIWGEVFRGLSPSDRAAVHQRISNLSEYVKSIQK